MFFWRFSALCQARNLQNEKLMNSRIVPKAILRHEILRYRKSMATTSGMEINENIHGRKKIVFAKQFPLLFSFAKCK